MDPYRTVVGSLQDLKLLDAGQVEELITLGEAPSTIDHSLESTVSMIQRRGWLTEFQAEVVLSGASRDLVLGPYALLDVLGRGGMGVVYRAKHQGTGRLVAIKVIKDEAAGDSHRLSRFEEEAQILRRLSHPNVVEVVEVADSKSGPYLVMELLTGGSLDDWAKEGPIAVDRAVGVVETLARAMHSVHLRQIIHRDLKPANVLFDQDGVPKVADFGLAKLLDSEARLTRTGDVLGTPAYMAPEQAAGRSKLVGPPTDVHALGIILYELLTGKRPFGGATTLEVLEEVRTLEPAVPSSHRPGLPKGLETICLKCLDKEPAHRYPTAEALADDLRRFQGGAKVVARRPGVTRKASKWRRRNPARSTLLIAGVALACFGLGSGAWYYDAYRRPKVAIFRDYVRRLGVPEGRGPIDRAEAGRRASSYKLTSRGGRVEQMEVVDGLGRLTTWSGEGATLGHGAGANPANRECRYLYPRKADGSLDRELAFDRFGNQLWALQYNNSATANYLNALGYSNARAASGATYLGYLRTPEGDAREIHYLNKVGNPLPNDEGVYGVRFELDAGGKILGQTFLDRQYRPTLNRTARYTTQASTYGEDGLLLERRMLDTQGRPATGKDGYSIERYARDRHGNQAEVAYFDARGRPAFNKVNLVHAIRTEYDDRGFPTASAYVDAAGRPCVAKGGYARNTRAWDEEGNLVDERAFDVEGKLAPNSDGYARVIARFDAKNHQVETRYLDASGKPAPAYGYSRLDRSFDDRGNVLEEAYFDDTGRPAMATTGWARIAKTYDDRNNVLTAAYLGTDGRPTTIKEGYAGIRHLYDDSDNQVVTEFLDGKGGLTYSDKGYARTVRTYNDQGQMLTQLHERPDGSPAAEKSTGACGGSFVYDAQGYRVEGITFGPDARPIASKLGFARMKMAYDERGLVVDTRLYDADNVPVVGSTGFARKTTAYDDRGNKVDEAFFDAKGRPTCTPPEGIHRTKIRYDERDRPSEIALFGVDGQPAYDQQQGYSRAEVRSTYGDRIVTETALYDVEGRPAIAKDGYHRNILVADLLEHELERTYLDRAGNPTLNKEGFSRQVGAYDARGNLTMMAFYGVDGRPTFVSSLGCARAEKAYDERGNNIEEAYFGPDDRPVLNKKYGVARVISVFDSRNRQVELRNYGLDGKPTMSDERAARATFRHDERGNMIEGAFFDVDDRPTLSIRGCARAVQAYDDQNNIVELGYFGVDGRPIRDAQGVATYRYERDALGRMAAETFFGPDGKPSASRLGPARVTYLRDDGGNVVEEAYFDVDGKPTRGEVGVSKQVRKFDRQGNKVDMQIFDPLGRPMADGAGISRRVAVYDARGNLLEQSRFDVVGKLAADREDGAARIVNRYDERGQRVETSAFGPDGRPCRIAKIGAAVVRTAFDPRGHLRTVTMFDEEGKPTMSAVGPARAEFVYDEMGRELEEAAYDIDGKPTLSIEGCFRLVNHYGPRGYCDENRYYGPDGQPCLVPDGYSRRAFLVSPDLSRRETAYFGLDDAPVKAAMGYARIVEDFVPGTTEVAAESYFGTDGRPVLSAKGYARVVRARDDRGRVAGESYFGVDGLPLVGKDGTSGYLSKFDVAGLEVEKTFLDAKGKPGPNPEGVTRLVRLRDPAGREVGLRQYGPDGAPIVGKNGYWGIDREYAPDGRVASQAAIGLDRVRTVKFVFDEKMKIVARVFYRHPTIKPAATTYAALAPVVIERPNQPGPSSLYTFFEDEGGPPFVHPDGYHGFRKYFDGKGREMAITYLGLDEKPTLHKDGMASIIYKLDDAGRRVRQTCFGLDERQAPNRFGFVALAMAYDAASRVTDESFHDAGGALVPHKDLLYARCTTAYDARGNVIKAEYSGPDGKPVESDFGYARVERTFDPKGLVVSARYFAADGRELTTRVVVREVFPGTPGEKLGMKAGDVLLEYDGRKLDVMANYLAFRRLEPADGPPHPCRVLRGDRELTVDFPPGTLGLLLVDKPR